MNRADKGGKHWFTAADVLITVIVIALAVGAAVLFLFPNEEETTALPVETVMLIHLPETPVGFAEDDKIFNEGTEIGTISKIEKRDNNVIIYALLFKDDGVYMLGGKPLRVNGSFVLETKLCRATGVIESIDERGDAE